MRRRLPFLGSQFALSLALTERNRKWWTVAIMSLTAILAGLDSSGIIVILPSIGSDLDASTTEVQWVVSIYLLALTAPLVALGGLADIIGRRKVLLVGIVVFAAASTLCGLAQSGWWIVGARALQGVGAASFSAATLAIVREAFVPEERGKAIGLFISLGAVGGVLGPLVGGGITDFLYWRWFFYLATLLTIVAFLLTLALVRESRDETAAGHQVDFLGIASVTVGLSALVLALQESDDLGWRSALVLGSLVVAVALLTLFVLIEARVRYPLLEFGIFRSRGYLGASIVAFFANFGTAALALILALYLQNVLDLSPSVTGVLFMASAVMYTLAGATSGWLEDKLGTRIRMVVGMAVVSASYGLVSLVSATNGLLLVLAAFAMGGLGHGLATTASSTAAMASVIETKPGVASGVFSMVRKISTVLGLVITGVLFDSREDYKLEELITAAGSSINESDREVIEGMLSGARTTEIKLRGLALVNDPEQAKRVVDEAFVYAMYGSMLFLAVMSVLGLLASIVVVEKRQS